MPIKNLDTIAKLLRIDVAKLHEAAKSETEVEVEIPADLDVLTKAERETRENNLKSTNIEAGKEIMVKELKKATNLEFEGKNPEKFIAEFQAKVLKDANVSVDEKIKERDKTIEGLRKNLGERETMITSLKTEAMQAKADSTLLGMLPKERASILSDAQYLSLIKAEYELTEHEGKPAVKNLKTGEIVKKDTTLEPLAPADVIKGHFESSKWIATQEQGGGAGKGGGRGAGDSQQASGITNMKQFKDYASSKGMDLKGQAAQAELAKITAANPNFDFNTN